MEVSESVISRINSSFSDGGIHFATPVSSLRTSEIDLVRGVLQMMQGLSSSLFFWDDNGHCFRVKSGIYVIHLSETSLYGVLDQFMYAATHLKLVEVVVNKIEKSLSSRRQKKTPDLEDSQIFKLEVRRIDSLSKAVFFPLPSFAKRREYPTQKLISTHSHTSNSCQNCNTHDQRMIHMLTSILAPLEWILSLTLLLFGFNVVIHNYCKKLGLWCWMGKQLSCKLEGNIRPKNSSPRTVIPLIPAKIATPMTKGVVGVICSSKLSQKLKHSHKNRKPAN